MITTFLEYPGVGMIQGNFSSARFCDVCPDKHIIVDEDHFIPPFDKELYKHVEGRRVSIHRWLVNSIGSNE